MKFVNKITESNQLDFACVDWKDINGVFEQMDKLLQPYGLELVMGNAGDDNFWFKIEPITQREGKK